MSAARTCFVDTNIFVYAYGFDDPEKHAPARRLIRQLAETDSLLISAQVLSEFYNTLARKSREPLHQPMKRSPLALAQELASFAVVPLDAETALAAMALSETSRISYWDALIVEAALRGGADVLYSEDLNHGQRFDSLVVENPFHAAT